jgi:hypothetical protein
MTFECHLEPQEGLEVAGSEIRRIWWLGDGWNLVLRQQVLHFEGGVTGCIVMAQVAFVSARHTATY